MRRKLTSCRGTAKVDTDGSPQATLQTAEVGAIEDTVAHGGEELAKVGAAKVGTGLEFCQGIDLSTNAVQDDVLCGIHVELLCQIGVNFQELHSAGTRNASSLAGLLLERREKGLEPLKRVGVLADPDELNATKPSRRVRAISQVPDVLENRSPGSHTDAGSDQDGDFVLEYILSRGTIRSVDPQAWHGLAILKRDLVHSHGVDAFVELGLRATGTDCVTKVLGEIAHLSDVDRDIRVIRARSDGKGMPLILGNRRDLEEEPLASLVLERRLVELDLHHICKPVSWPIPANATREPGECLP